MAIASMPLRAYRHGMDVGFKQSMAPVGSTDAVLLILGSLPGEASLGAQRYYAHPQNQFWRLVGQAIGEPFATAEYAERLDRLNIRGIAVWDVVGAARRVGSLDSAIRDARANPLANYVATHPRLAAIAFNGKTAATIGRRALSGVQSVELIDLPSSSPAYTLAYAAKADAWGTLGRLALPREIATLGE